MKVGIVSRCVRESPKGFVKKVKVYSFEDEILVAEIPISGKDTNAKKLKKQTEKARKMLEKQGVKRIITADELKEKPFDAGEVFYLYAHKAAIMAVEWFKISKPVNLYVKQKSVDDKAEVIIGNLIYDAGKIGILTEDYSKGEELAGKILREYGAYTRVYSYDYMPDDGVIVIPDAAEIYVFKWKLENFTADIDCHGYNVNSIELFQAKNGNFDEILIKDCQCGKNKLTLAEK